MDVGDSTERLCLTSDVACAISKFLDLLFGENAEDDNKVLSLFETLVGLFEGFWVDETTVNLSPSRTWWNAFLMRLRGGLSVTFHGVAS